MDMQLIEKDYVIRTIPKYYNNMDIKSIGRKLDIPEGDFYADGLTMSILSDKLVERVFQLSKYEDLKSIINEDSDLKRINFFNDLPKDYYSSDPLDNVKAKSFGKFYTTLLSQLDNLEEKDFDESELIEPVKFEEKMRHKAKLNEDIINGGIALKNDIVSLRKRANALDYSSYDKLLQRIGRIYRNILCSQYPEDEVLSSIRYRKLYNVLYSCVPDEIKEDCEDIDMYVEGIIYDTIAHCLIFNK
ncbi:hypothetical protein C7M60_17480 [Clostridium botulinum]|nr:hypothetical protein C7M60_17480 [Clostridium botulinum]AVQ50829.1 hypothetical protein C7M58_16470 [Clostridium botulinum]